MKKYIFIITAVMLFTSCEKEIELEPISDLTYNGFWDTEEAARAAQSGIYSTFRGGASTFWVMGEVRSDFYGGRTFESPSNLNLINQIINTTQVPFANWAGFYSHIHRINDFLYNIENVPFASEIDKRHLKGQVYGIRAFYYYTMLKTWGGVPITTEPLLSVNPDELSKPRASQEELMAQIKADIQSSLDAFGSDNSFWQGSNVYWSKAATLALKGDVYIWSGTLLNGGSSDYTEAKNALQQIGSMGFALESGFEDMFSVANEANDEFIFAIDYQQDQAGNFYTGLFTGRSTEINQTWDDRGNSYADFVANGGNRYGPSEKLLLALDDTLDTRRDATFTRLYSNDAGNYYPYQLVDEYSASILSKFLGEVVAGVRISTNNVPVYRYADVLLLLAEAKNRLGEDPSAEINAVRQRAYGENYDALTHAYVNGSQDDNTKAILDERLKEFVGEGKRWWDLRRAGGSYIFDEVETLPASEAYKLLLPITPDMIGRNPALEQTPGYE